MRQKNICEYCGSIGHKSYSYIIHGPKFLPPSLREKNNQFNSLHGDEPKEPPRYFNSQPPADYFESRISPSRTNPIISAIMGKINHHAIDNGDVKILTSDFPAKYNYESVPDPDTTPITNPIISAIMGKINHHAIDNGDVKILTSLRIII